MKIQDIKPTISTANQYKYPKLDNTCFNYNAQRIIDLRPEVNNYIKVCKRLNEANWSRYGQFGSFRQKLTNH